MSQDVGTYLLFTEQPETPLRDLIEALAASGWTLSKRRDQYRYRINDDHRKTDSKAEVRANVDTGASGSVKLERENVKMIVTRNSKGVPSPNVRLWADGHVFEYRSSRESYASIAAKNVEIYLSAIESALECLHPAYAYGESPDGMPSDLVPTADDLSVGRFRYVFWLNAFGPGYVEAIGRERLESAPGWRVEELDNDLFLVVAADNPVDISDEWADGKQAVADHLGVPYP